MRTRACLARVAVAVLACLSLAGADGLAATPSVSAGGTHGVAVKSDGSVIAWGSDNGGQLGQGRTLSSSLPLKVPGLTEALSISAGQNHVLALLRNGTVWSWGANDTGQLGDGTTTARSAPMQVSGLPPITAVSAGNLHSLALASDGSVWSWGWNAFGQLGDGSVVTRTLPVRIPGLTNIRWIATGENHSLALDGDGVVWAWGFNPYGQLGDGTTTNRASPVRITGLGPIARISAGAYHSAAVAFDRTLWTWGLNEDGQLGDGTTTNRSTPVRVDLPDVIGVSAGGQGVEHRGYTIAILGDRTLAAWGDNEFGQLGDGTATSRSTPSRVLGLAGVAAYDTGATHSVAVMQDGSVWTWGNNSAGELGNGTRSNSALPRPVVGVTAMTDVSAGDGFTAALANDGTIAVWGDNTYGELAIDFTQGRPTPTHVDISDIAVVSAGGNHNLAVKASGEVWAWGSNGLGQLGDGSVVSRATAGQVSNLSGIVQVAAGSAHSLALGGDGSVWAWGDNRSGQVGNGSVTRSELLPSRVLGLPASQAISAGNCHSVALATDGTVWEWGTEGFSLCVGPPRTRPVRIVGLANIVAIAAGSYHTLAVQSDGTVWAWGYNVNGQLGIGNTSSSSSPVRVALPSPIRSVAGGSYHSLALARDGTVWGWGENSSGQVGDGSTILATLPVRVVDLTDIVAISAGTDLISGHSLALKADGSTWAWGSNVYGQLGDGTLALRARPVVVVREGGAGTVPGGDWFLDLNPAVPKAIPSSKVPPFLMVTSGSISSGRATLLADLKFKPEDIGKPIYLFAYVRGSKSGIAKDGNDSCTLQQTSPSGQTVPPGASGLQPTGANVTNAASQAQTMLDNAPTAGKEGNTYCTGVGATAQAAVANGRCAATIPGSTNPCIPPETAAAPVTSYQALWWNPAESGWGVNIAHQGDKLFATWFTYDADRSGMWLVMSNSSHNADGSYSGELARTTGPGFSATPWSSAGVVGTVVGSARFTFSDARHGTFAYTVNNVSQTKAIERLDFAAPVPTCSVGGDAGASPNYSDLWWASPAGSENGWGLNIVHQGDILFATWYTYGTASKGMWLSMSDGRKSSANSYSGTLQRSTGPAFNAVPWNASEVTRPTAGTATLTFADSNNGTFAYVLDGVSQSKAITRLIFAAPGSVCR
jgi:alpha-tubulin suppressor-like RCC1 family protein